jgi:hypothetical protein
LAAITGVDASSQPNGIGPTFTRGVNDALMPPLGSPSAVVRAKAWINATSPDFLYPEQDPKGEHYLPILADKPSFGVAMSGGGLRAAILMLGYGRVLWREGLLQKARYVGSSSGSSWFLAAFSYANGTRLGGDGGYGGGEGIDGNVTTKSASEQPRFDGDAFFGQYLPPERLTEQAAQQELGSWGKAVAEAQMTPHSLMSGIAYRRRALTWWTDAVADLFLRPFGLHDLSSGTSAEGTKGPVAERVAKVLLTAFRAKQQADSERAADALAGNLQAVEAVRGAALKAGATPKLATAAAKAADFLLKTNATKVEEQWQLAAKIGVKRVWPSEPAGAPPPVFLACTQDRPYPLLAGTIHDPQDPLLFYPFEMTPMYVGSPGVYEQPSTVAASPVGALGGGLLEAHAWNSRLTRKQSRAAFEAARAAMIGEGGAGAQGSTAVKNNSSTTTLQHKHSIDVDATVDYFVPLAGQAAVSSGYLAQGFRPSSSPLKQLMAVDHFYYWNQLDFSKSGFALFGDGGGADPLGLYGHLRRGVKALLVLHATFQEPTGAAEEFALAGGYEIAQLFGVVPRGATRYSGTDEQAAATAAQVFAREHWAPLYQELRARFYAGEPAVIRRKGLRVLPNAFQAIRGGYDADVVFVFNVKTAGWEERLSLATRVQLERGRGNNNSPLGSYPAVPTGLAHAGPGLTALLGQQASWVMIQALPTIKAMLADLPAGERGVGRFETTVDEAQRAPAESAAMAVGLKVGEAPWPDVDRADAGLGIFGEKMLDRLLEHVPEGPTPLTAAAEKLGAAVAATVGRKQQRKGGDSEEAAASAAALASASSSSFVAPHRGPGAAAVVGNAAVMAALARAPAESGVGSAVAALAAAASPMLVDGRPPTRAEARAAALAGNDPRPAHERWMTRQYTRAQALGSALGGLRTQLVADTAGRVVAYGEKKMARPAVEALQRATDVLAPVKGPLLRSAANALAMGDLHGANPPRAVVEEEE